MSLRECAFLVGKLGYDGIELGPEWLNEPVNTLLGRLEGTGVAVSAIVGSLDLLNTDPRKREAAVALERRRLEMARELNADGVIEVPAFGSDKFSDVSPVMTPMEVENRLLLHGLERLAPDVRRTGITLLLEPLNRKETHFMRTQQQGAEIIQSLGKRGSGC